MALEKIKEAFLNKPSIVTLLEDTVKFYADNLYPVLYLRLNWPTGYEKIKKLSRIEYTLIEYTLMEYRYRFLIPGDTLALVNPIPIRLSPYVIEQNGDNVMSIDLLFDTLVLCKDTVRFFVAPKGNVYPFVSENYWIPTFFISTKIGEASGNTFICNDIGGSILLRKENLSFNIQIGMGIDYTPDSGVRGGVKDIIVGVAKSVNIKDKTVMSLGGMVTIPSSAAETPLRILSTKSLDVGLKLEINHFVTEHGAIGIMIIPINREFIFGKAGAETDEIIFLIGYKVPSFWILGYKVPSFWIYGRYEWFIFQTIPYLGTSKVAPELYGKSELSVGGKFKMMKNIIVDFEIFPLRRIPKGLVTKRKIWLPNGNTFIKIGLGIKLGEHG